MKITEETHESELTTVELEHLMTTLKGHGLTGKHLEIGTAAGGTLWRMVSSFEESVRPQFVAVDPMQYFPGQLDAVKNNLSSHGIDPESVDIRVKTSNEALREAKAKGERFDVVFIDGVHKIRYVIDDLGWTQLLNEGGLLLMHDYCDKHPDVQLAANRFLKKNPNYEIISQGESLLVIRKNTVSGAPEISFADIVWAALYAPRLQLRRSIAKRRNKKK